MASCSLEGSDMGSGTGIADLIDVEVPDTVALFADTIIKATAAEYNGCWIDLNTKFTKLGDFEYEIKAFGTYESYGTCPSVLVTEDTVLNFTPEKTGQYLFRIYKKSNKILTDTMLVE